MKTSQKYIRSAIRQRGVVAIEFALLFILFFAVFYGAVSYSTWFLIKQGLTQAATNGARAALRASPLSFTGDSYDDAIQKLGKDAIGASLSWASKPMLDKINGPDGISITFKDVTTSLPAGNGKFYSVIHRRITVKVSYPDYATDPLVPVFSLPGIGPVPPLPPSLDGISVQWVS